MAAQAKPDYSPSCSSATATIASNSWHEVVFPHTPTLSTGSVSDELPTDRQGKRARAAARFKSLRGSRPGTRAAQKSMMENQHALLTPPETPERGGVINRGLKKVMPALFRQSQTPATPGFSVTRAVEALPRALENSLARFASTPAEHDDGGSEDSVVSSSAASVFTVKHTDSTAKTSADSKASSNDRQSQNKANGKEVQSDLEPRQDGRDCRPMHGSSFEAFSDLEQECPITPTILTVEKASAAKVFLESHFRDVFSQQLTSREVRSRALQDEICGLGDNIAPVDKTRLQWEFQRQETQYLRETRVMKARGNRLRPCWQANGSGNCRDDYEVLKKLGKGSFGAVRLVRDRAHPDRFTGQSQYYAMKCIRKADMLRNDQEGHLNAERDFLVRAEGSRWVVPLVSSFQDASHLYLVMEYMPGGDFLGHLIRERLLTEEATLFYVAEMILCVQETHKLGYIHRDLKPDNFLISASGHLKIADFGLAFDGHWSHDKDYFTAIRYSLVQKLQLKISGDDQDRREVTTSITARSKWLSHIHASIDRHGYEEKLDEPLLEWRDRHGRRVDAKSGVGTSQYMAPEVVQGTEYDGRCDWWSIGIILYECLYGNTPFQSMESRQQTKQNVLNYKNIFTLPIEPVVSNRCMNLIRSLIRDKRDRLCSVHYRFKDEHRQAVLQGSVATDPTSEAASNTRYYADQFVFPEDAQDIKAHKWFRNIDWNNLHRVQPPFVPRPQTIEDTRYFDEGEDITYWSDTDEEDDKLVDDDGQRAGPSSPSLAMGGTTIRASSPICQQEPQQADPPIYNNPLSIHAPVFVPQSQKKATTLSKREAREVALAHALSSFSPSVQEAMRGWLATPYDSERMRKLENNIDGNRELTDSECETLKAVAKAFGRKEKKRPQDRLLRDPDTKGVVLKERMKTAFLNYTWKRGRVLSDGQFSNIRAIVQESRGFGDAGSVMDVQGQRHAGVELGGS